MSNIADEIIKTIQYAIDKKTVNCDRTFKTVVKRVTPKGYVILDETGNDRTVECCIPGVVLTPGQSVYVKVIQGKFNNMYICGVCNGKRVMEGISDIEIETEDIDFSNYFEE